MNASHHDPVAEGLGAHSGTPKGKAPLDVFPLSFTQESVWLSEQIAPGNTAYNVAEAWRLTGPLDVKLLSEAAGACVRRHESLRTRLAVVDGRPVQVPMPFEAPRLQVDELRGKESELGARLAAEAQRPFELKGGTLMRLRLFRLGEQEHVLSLNLHHLICDEWSLRLFWEELASEYTARADGKSADLPALPIQYADFAVWQREMSGGEQVQKQLRYWESQLAAPLPVMELPVERARPAVPSFRGRTEFLLLDRELVKGLEALSRGADVTLYMVLLGAFQTLLHRYTRQSEVIVGSPVAGRQRVETERVVGFFANMLPMRTDLKGNPRFVELLRRVREVVLAAHANQDVTLANILERVQRQCDLSRHPLVQVVLALQPAEPSSRDLFGLKAERLELDNGGAKFDWSLLLTPCSEGLRLRSEYSTELFAPGTIAGWVRQWETLLRSIVARPEARLSELALLNQREQQQLIAHWNPSHAPSECESCLHEWFERQAASRPEATAVVFEGERLSYGELNARANQWARYLRQAGVAADKPVALLLERSTVMVVAILAVLKAGGCYVPLEPSAPTERLRFMLEDTQAQWVLTQERLARRLPAGAAQVICLDLEEAKAARGSAEDLTDGDATPATRAYIIYTSGSTGQPKGVQVTHQNVVRLFQQTRPWFGFNAADVWTLFHSYTFDFSVWEIWGALLYGGRLAVVPYLVSRSPREFLELLSTEQVTVLNQTPSAFRQLLCAEANQQQALALSLRYIIFGGEALPLQSLRPWFERHGDERPRLVNMYGITETTVHVTYRPIRQSDLERDLGSVIGIPIPDLRLYLLDEYLQPVPPGVPGEICIAGSGVARGYLNRPELTAQRFVGDPLAGDPAARMYRSGDLARVTATGELEYLGRMDEQVKLRGYRIELGEIEQTLNRHGAVRESAVLLLRRSANDEVLRAYVVPRQERPEAEQLRVFMHAQVPEYMVPSEFLFLDKLPLTLNGKVDRQALAALQANVEEAQGTKNEPPRSELERQVAESWCAALKRKAIGVHENFFAAGGHSLLATQIMGRLAAALNMELSVRLLFEAPTVAGLAGRIGQLQRQSPAARLTIPRRSQAAEAQELLSRLEQLSAEELDQILGPSGVGTISA